MVLRNSNIILSPIWSQIISTHSTLGMATYLETRVSGASGSVDDDKGSVSAPEEFALLKVKKEANIVFVGKSGAGKSVLKDNILDIKQGLVLSSGHITNSYATETVEKHGVAINIIDTVGLQGGRSRCRASLKKMAKYIKGQGNVDLLVYCISVSPSSKFEEAEPAIIESLHDAFGRDIWKKCIIVFTFSNLILDRIRKNPDTTDGTTKYKAHMKDYATKLECQLKKLNISVKTVFDLPLEAPQPVGHTTIMAIPAGDEPEDQVLPGIQYESLKISFRGSDQTQEFALSTWSDVIFIEMVKKSNADLKNLLLRYRYKLSKIEKGAIVGGVIGIIGAFPGIVVGAAVGAGIAAVMTKE